MTTGSIPARAAAAALAAARSTRPLSLLLIEAEVLARMTTAQLLAGQGHTAHGAGSVAKTQAMDAAALDMLIADIELPDAGRVPPTRKLQAHFPSLSVIIASGRGPQPVPPNITSLGRPYDLPQLCVELRAVVSHSVV